MVSDVRAQPRSIAAHAFLQHRGVGPRQIDALLAVFLRQDEGFRQRVSGVDRFAALFGRGRAQSPLMRFCSTEALARVR